MNKGDMIIPKDEDKLNKKDEYEIDKYLGTYKDNDSTEVHDNKHGTSIISKSVNSEIKSTIEPIKIVEALDVIQQMIRNFNESEDIGIKGLVEYIVTK